MIKAFLSHSSSDKKSYVRIVANWLGKDNIIYDEYTFEEGEKTLDEILRGIGKTGLFVFFISDKSLNSDWVKKEIIQAKFFLDKSFIDKFFPIIIDEKVSYTDNRIPNWIRETYNLRLIKRPQVVAKRIHTKLRELSWLRHPQLKKRQSLFVGRNDKQDEFEERIHDFEKQKPFVIIASGMNGVGRRTFLHRALYKTNLTDIPHRPSALLIDRDVSIEDFILKLNDLGLVDFGKDILCLTTMQIKDKIKLIHRVMQASYDAREIIYMVDEGCLINYRRELTSWFLEAINTYEETPYPIFCVASKYKVNFQSRPNNNKFFFLELNELNTNERKNLFSQLLEIYNVDLKVSDFKDIANLLCGFPDQVMYAVDLIHQDNQSSITAKMPLIRQYGSDKAAVVLKKYETNEDALDFIRLLAQFEVITMDFIFSIVSEKKFYPILQDLASELLVELIGIDGEIVRLSDIVRDYIKRNRINISEKYNKKIQEQVKIITQDDDIFERDSSEYIFVLKESLKEGNNLDEKLLIPSHYLRCMKDLYYTRGNLDRIIELADIIIQKKETLDRVVLKDIRYYLCLALAKRNNSRMLREVQNINGDEHTFLLGFYYRNCGRYKDALDQYNKILDAPYVGARSKREVVQVYVQLEEYDKALDFARKNYEENRVNQFHAQAYFNCLINSEQPKKFQDKLLELIDNLRTIDSDQSNEMADIGEALFYAKVNFDKQTAMDKIIDCVRKYRGIHYPVLAFCDIAIKFKDKDSLRQGVDILEKICKKKNLSARTYIRHKAFLYALEGREDKALQIFQDELARYPIESKDRITTRIKEYSAFAKAS